MGESVLAGPVTIRRATSADIPGFVALGRAVVPPTYGPIDAVYAQRMLDEWWIPEVFEKSLARNTHLVAEQDGMVVAMSSFGRLSRSYREFPHVTGDREVMWKLYVHPDHQGTGLGRRLLAEVEAMVEGEELWLESVDGNDRAYAFYLAQGFDEVERVSDGRFPDDIWMRKRLGSTHGRPGAGSS